MSVDLVFVLEWVKSVIGWALSIFHLFEYSSSSKVWRRIGILLSEWVFLRRVHCKHYLIGDFTLHLYIHKAHKHVPTSLVLYILFIWNNSMTHFKLLARFYSFFSIIESCGRNGRNIQIHLTKVEQVDAHFSYLHAFIKWHHAGPAGFFIHLHHWAALAALSKLHGAYEQEKCMPTCSTLVRWLWEFYS